MPFTMVSDIFYVKLTSNKKSLANFTRILRFLFRLLLSF